MKQRLQPFLLLLLLGVSGTAGAQVTIRGTITGSKGQPIPNASIVLKDTYDGATADSAGRFSFTSTEKGNHVLEVSSANYRPLQYPLNLDNPVPELKLQLKEEISELRAVVLTAGTFEASDRKRAGVVLDPIDIVTTASANGDVTGALKTLPGAQQVGESEGLFVRGGTAAETKTFIDGTLVNNFFFSSVPNVAQFSRFSPFLFKGTVFSTGGYSALYGQGLSSALILESIDLPDRSSASAGVSVIGLSAGIQHLAKDKKSSYGFNYSYTNLTPAFEIIKQKQDYSKAPAYHSGDANFRIKTSGTGILKYYGYFSANKLAFTTGSIDSLGYLDRFSIKNFNSYHNLSWKENMGGGWKVNLGISYSNNKDNINAGMTDTDKQEVELGGLEAKNFGVESKGDFINTKAVFEKRLKALSALRFGAEYNIARDRNDYIDFNGNLYRSRLNSTLGAAFGEADIYITNSLAAKTGVRLEHSSLIDEVNIAPRLSLAYKLGKAAQASLAYGIFYQDPERRYLPASGNLTFMKATHYIAQYQRVADNQTFRAEVFYKKYDNLIKTVILNFRESAANNDGYGDAQGIEFFWRDKKTIKNLDYWISYSYLDTKRDFLNFPMAISPSFAAKHTASLVMKKFVQSWKLNLNGSYNYASGRPYYFIDVSNGTSSFLDRGRAPDYHNVSFSVNYLPFIGKKNPKSFNVFVLQVSNIFNIKQTYGYQYSYNGARKEAIVPPSRMFVFLGAFFNFGVDRSEEIINNGL
ncbi:MAG: TonB-dependent receptor [Chitinophagaceae bacterium]|nr:MAG: TonB-dependent receptor [Chitinophagaceae bacterium]